MLLSARTNEPSPVILASRSRSCSGSHSQAVGSRARAVRAWCLVLGAWTLVLAWTAAQLAEADRMTSTVRPASFVFNRAWYSFNAGSAAQQHRRSGAPSYLTLRFSLTLLTKTVFVPPSAGRPWSDSE
ncbi:hypothetical protein GY45DRAFT_835020 [Cubamyces sp. BRFM 1775]|nr:hypothetical protein GY45DRAFT_835020 [Cubamyces sp. BRFM 1775]